VRYSMGGLAPRELQAKSNGQNGGTLHFRDILGNTTNLSSLQGFNPDRMAHLAHSHAIRARLTLLKEPFASDLRKCLFIYGAVVCNILPGAFSRHSFLEMVVQPSYIRRTSS
jgi:hypothetical protein